MTKCNSLAGEIMGHKYSARFDYGAPTIVSTKGGSARETIELVEASKPAKYVCDICERCGHIVKRDAS